MPEPTVGKFRRQSTLMARRMGRLSLEACFDGMPVSIDRFVGIVMT